MALNLNFDLTNRKKAAQDILLEGLAKKGDVVQIPRMSRGTSIDDLIGEASNRYARRQAAGVDVYPQNIRSGKDAFEPAIATQVQEKTQLEKYADELRQIETNRKNQEAIQAAVDAGAMTYKGFNIKRDANGMWGLEQPPVPKEDKSIRPAGYQADLDAAEDAINRGADKEKVFRRLFKNYPSLANEITKFVYGNEAKSKSDDDIENLFK